MHGTVDQAVDLEEENAVMLSFGVPPDVLREVTRERDEARDLLRQVAVALGCPDQAPDDLPSSVEALRLQRDRMRDITAAENEIGRLLAERLELRNGYDTLAGAFGLFPGASPAEVTARLQEVAERLTAAEERAAALEAAVERVRPVVEALASRHELNRLWWQILGRLDTSAEADAAWLRSLLPTTQGDR